MNHSMIDLETLSTENNAAVISIGVAIFNDSEVIDSAGWAISPDYWHGHISGSTVKFWAGAECDGARDFSFGGVMTDFGAAFQLKTFLAKHDAGTMWCNDPHFDYTILLAWWNRIGKERVKGQLQPWPGNFPFTYKQPRSYRTIVAEAERLGHEVKSARGIFVAHDPVEDAVSQARVVIEARKLIGCGAR